MRALGIGRVDGRHGRVPLGDPGALHAGGAPSARLNRAEHAHRVAMRMRPVRDAVPEALVHFGSSTLSLSSLNGLASITESVGV